MTLRFPTIILLSVLSLCVWSSAQQTPPPAAPPDPEQEIEKKEQSQRMIVIPQFAVTNRKPRRHSLRGESSTCSSKAHLIR